MANVAFTITTSAPNFIPTYDPRAGSGIAFHVDSTNNNIWVGLSTVGSENWGRFSTSSILTANEEAEVGSFTVAPPVVTTSNASPTLPPQFIPSDGRIHIHLAYKLASEYTMYIGVGETQWEIFNIVEVI